MAPTFPRPYGAPAPRNQTLDRPTRMPRPGAMEKPQAKSAVRRYDMMYLDALGNIEDTYKVAPAIEAFEASCGAFAHGTMIQTDNGEVPVEDLLPGQMIMTKHSGPQPLQWIGSMMLVPNATDPRITPARMTRITENSIGLGRPTRDLVLGPHARILRRNAACLSLFGTDSAFAPATAFTDGVSIIEIQPVSSVRVFNLQLDGQHVITAGGIEVESYHPGRRDSIGLTTQLLPMYLELFPHIEDLQDFGQMRVPRLSHDDIRSLESE